MATEYNVGTTQPALVTHPSRGLTKGQIAARVVTGICLAAIVGGALALHFGHPAGGIAVFCGVVGTLSSLDANVMANKAAEAARKQKLGDDQRRNSSGSDTSIRSYEDRTAYKFEVGN